MTDATPDATSDITPDAQATRPAAGEHDASFGPYIAQVPDGSILETLVAQRDELIERWSRLEDRAEHRYADGKWSIKEVLGHLVDCERVFGYRALCASRGDATSLPGFDENEYNARGRHHQRPLAEILGEYNAVRESTLALLAGLDDVRLTRLGRANGSPVSARAAAWITAGHERHHANVIEERYL